MAEKATELSIVIAARNDARAALNGLKGQLGQVNDFVVKNRESLLAMGRALLFVGAIGTGFLGAGILQAADFEQSIANVKAISNATAEEQRLLGDAALEMGAKTSKSASEAAQAQLFLAQAGLTVRQNIEALPGVINLAEAASSDLAFTTQLVVATLSQFNLVAGESGRVANVFAAASANSLANLEKLAFAMRQVGPVASALGLSLEDTVAILSRLFDAGLRGEQAGTALRAVMLSLSAPAGEAADVLERLGVNIRDAAGNARPFLEILEAVGNAGATTEQAVRIFGREAVAAFENLRGSGTVLEAMTETITGTNEATRQAADRLDTFKGSATLLASSLEVLALTAILPLLPAFQAVIDLVNQVVLFFNAMPVPIKVVIVLMAGMTTATLILVGALALLAPGIATLLTALRSLTVVLPIASTAATATGGAFVFGAGSATGFSAALVRLRVAALALIASPLAPWIIGITVLGTLAVTIYNRWFKSIEKTTEAIKDNQKALADAAAAGNQNNNVTQQQAEAAKKLADAYSKLGIKDIALETRELRKAFRLIKNSGRASGEQIEIAYAALQEQLENLKPVQKQINDEFLKALNQQVRSLEQKRALVAQTFQLEIAALEGVRQSLNTNFDAQEKVLQNIKAISDEIKASQKSFGGFELQLSLKGLSEAEQQQRQLQAAQQALRDSQNLSANERVTKLNEIIETTQRLALESKQGSLEEFIALQSAKRAQEELIAAQKQRQDQLVSERESLGQTHGQLRIVQQTLRETLDPLNQLDEKLKTLKAIVDLASFDEARSEAQKLREEFESTFSKPIEQVILVKTRQVESTANAFFDQPAAEVEGSFASGLPRVPRDMIVQVHRGEAILTRSEAEQRRSGKDGGGGVGVRDINFNFPNITSGVDRETVRREIIPELDRYLKRKN